MSCSPILCRRLTIVGLRSRGSSTGPLATKLFFRAPGVHFLLLFFCLVTVPFQFLGFRLCFSHMNAAFLKEIKAKLVEEQARLEMDLKDMGYHKDEDGNITVDTESGGNSDDDNASEVTAFADGMSVAERLESELKDVKKALASIEAGTYGICKYCKKPIDEKRLMARPSSSSCIECKKTLTQEL